MAYWILKDEDLNRAVLYDSTYERPFGPGFVGDVAREELEFFLSYVMKTLPPGTPLPSVSTEKWEKLEDDFLDRVDCGKCGEFALPGGVPDVDDHTQVLADLGVGERWCEIAPPTEIWCEDCLGVATEEEKRLHTFGCSVRMCESTQDSIATAHRDRNPCYVCGRDAGELYYSDRRTDSGPVDGRLGETWGDVALVLCESCSRRGEAMPDAEAFDFYSAGKRWST
jgi:hypothetical protein